MTPDLFPQPWWINNLLDEGFIRQKAQELQAQPLPYALADWLRQHFCAPTLAQTNEAQLEHGFIYPLLAHMGWQAVPQMHYTVQGKQVKPDWCLALAEADKRGMMQAAASTQADKHNTAQTTAHIAAICEAKAWDKALDTGRANDDNPHHQLQGYLSMLRVRFGILTNGRHWRLYDTQEITARKTYLQIDLEQVMQLPDSAEQAHALALFAFFFGRDTYVPPATQPNAASVIEQTLQAAQCHALAVEENLKAVIYGFDGEDSLFERMGKALYAAQTSGQQQPPALGAVYENTLIWLFRLLFVVYFEDKNAELLAKHPFYGRYSLKNLYARLRASAGTAAQPSAHDAHFDGIHDLKNLFDILDAGAQDIDIPLFNGGLFDAARAPLLGAAKIVNNAALRDMLEKLLFKTHRGNTLFDTPRDFKNMSVTHLGRIYEGLLEFRFEKAFESATYLEYSSAATKGQTVEAYFDSYDTELIKKEKGFRAWREISVKKGDIYLKSASNSRKTSASYYTPPALSQHLVKAGIDHALAQGKALTSIKVLDNACGSGHFLVEALGYLTDLALQRLPQDPALQQLVADESAKIHQQLAFLNLHTQPETTPGDAQILKRALLKRCIYGLDLNPFAVELARLSLWIDSFIFGTPLSFIEHHIQHGNALLGASVADFIAYNATEQMQGDLFVQDLRGRFDELRSVMQQLDALRDTTADEVAQSKQLWRQDIAPKLALLGRSLSFLSTRNMLLAAGDKAAVAALDKTPDLLTTLFDSATLDPRRTSRNPVLKAIASHQQQWHFFHYEVAFPEAFTAQSSAQTAQSGQTAQSAPTTSGSHAKGFDVIVGNPPWDKTKFSDTDFFPQYHSNYRILKNTEKAAVQQRLLGSAHISQAYAQQGRAAEIANNAYKAAWPLNRGAGDGNLFRFFVERNLGLLNAGGSLNYVLPSALMLEEGSLALRQHILTHYRLNFFYSFENRQGLFPDVDSRYKFALMQIAQTATPQAATPPATAPGNAPASGQGSNHAAAIDTGINADTNAAIDTAFYLLHPDELHQPQRRIAYTLAALKTLSPQQWALMELRHAADLPILAKCYAAHPPLSPDWLDFRRELDMTNDKDLFLESPAPGLLPLFEGKMIWQYSHTLSQPQYWLDAAAFDARLHSKEIHRMAQDLGLSKAEAEKHAAAVRFDREYMRLGFRAIASDTNERTLIFALLPPHCGFGHSMFASAAKKYTLAQDQSVCVQAQSPLRLLFALAVFNSLVTDWLARMLVQINVSLTYLYRLPTPQPADDAAILQNPDYRTLARNALLLTLAADQGDLAAPLAGCMAQLGITPADIPTGPGQTKACDQLRAQNDAITARLYGITPTEFAHLLTSFTVMANKRPEYIALLHSTLGLPAAPALS